MSVAVIVAPTPTTGIVGWTGAGMVLEDDVALVLHAAPDRPFANAIFPWGTDAIFNRFQIPSLLDDLDAIAETVVDEDVRDAVRALTAYIRGQVEGRESDVYVVCLSD